jgi:hypothetical protein
MRFAVPGAGSAIRFVRTPMFHRLSVLVAPLAFALLALLTIWRPNAARTA